MHGRVTSSPHLREAIVEAAERHGTPLYLYDRDVLETRIRGVRRALGDRARLLYAVKANANVELLRVIAPLVHGADVASLGELSAALEAGFSPERSSFTGPAKSEAELSAAAEAGVLVSVESLREIDILAELDLLAPRRIALRLSPAERIHAFAARADDVFGLPPADVPEALARIDRAAPRLVLEGLHVHAGSFCSSAAAFQKHVEATLGLASRIGRPMRAIDFGGGFGIGAGRELDVESLGRKLACTWERLPEPPPIPVFEPGRYLVGPAGVYVARVVGVKAGTAILDGGMHHLLSATGHLGAHAHPIENVSNPDTERARCDLAGPLCTQLDRVRAVTIAPPRAGDLIAFFDAGAYGLSFSPLLFLGHPTPIEILREGETLRVIRRRHVLADFD